METNRNTRVLTNSFWLYLRLILNMGITLLSSRFFLNALGVNDFGTVNLLNSLICIFFIYTGSVSNVLQRFLNIQIKTGDLKKAQTFFSMVSMFTILVTAFVLIGESFACEWFLTHKLHIIPGQMGSARFLFYCLLCAIFFQIIVLPWQECILARERMGFFAVLYLSNSFLRLLLAVFLQYGASKGKLECYGIGMVLIELIFWLTAFVFCRLKIPESKFHLVWDWKICKEMLPFFSYNLIGGTLYNLTAQGIVVLFGMFFFPAVNAAYAIAQQIQGVLSRISTYLAMAVKPQMIQSYAGGEMEYAKKLFFSSSKLSFFAQFFVITPIVLEMPYLMKLWLKIVPKYTIVFTCLLCVSAMILSFTAVMNLVNMATGKNKNFETTGRFITIGSLGVAYIVLKFNAPPWAAVASLVLGDLCTAGYLLWDVRLQIKISLSSYFRNVLGVLLLCFAVSWGSLFFVKSVLPFDGFPRLIVLGILSLVVNITIFYVIGCSSEEKFFFIQCFTQIKQKISCRNSSCN